MKYFTNCTTLEEVKKEYKKACFKLHPDVSGKDTTAEFQAMQAEYEEAFERCKNTHKTAKGETYQKATTETSEEFKEIIEQLIKMNGVIVEIIGSFIWLSGNTKDHKEAIKALGFKWSSNKKMWYKAPSDYHRVSHKTYDINTIRNMYGSEIVSDGQQRPTVVNA